MTSSSTRAYSSARRTAQARRTRRRVLDAASLAFVTHGFAGTTIRAVAAAAEVSVATVELLFGTKARLLKAAIDVAIAGDDEPVAVLDRDWASDGLRADGAEAFLAIVAEVLAPAQARSAGLVLAAFEGRGADPELAALATQMVTQRTATAQWAVDTLATKTPLRPGLSVPEAVETLWLLMDPAVFDRLTTHRGWSVERYAAWFAESARHLLVADTSPDRTT